MSRDLLFEQEFLDGAERHAGLHGLGYTELVLGRLDLMDRRHGGRWLDLPPRRFVHEIRCEGLDVAGWPALFAQRLLLDAGGSDRALSARIKLQEIAAYGAIIEKRVRELQELLE
jgi:hypothetical protein